MKSIRKPSLMKILIIRFGIVFCIGIIILLVVTEIIKIQYILEREQENYGDITQIHDSIYREYLKNETETDLSDKEKSEKWNFWLQWYADAITEPALYSYGINEGQAIGIFNITDDKLQVKSKKSIYYTRRLEVDGRWENKIYRFEEEHMDEWQQIYNCLYEHDREVGKLGYSTEIYEVVLDGVYIKDDMTFTPERVNLIESNGVDEQDAKVLMSFDMTPNNKEDYTYISDTKDKSSNLIAFGMHKEEENIYTAKQLLEDVLNNKGDYDFGIKEVLDSMATESSYSDDNVQCYMDTLSLGEKEYLVIVAATYDFKGAKHSVLASAYLYISITLFVIWILWSAFNYKMAKGYYELDQYRKNATNILAHDMKTPLAAIMGYAENMQNHSCPNKESYYLSSIISNVDYINEMIEKVLDLGKIEEGKIILNKELVDVNEIFSELKNIYEEQLNKQNMHIEVAGELKLYTDKVLMQEALDNLINNAIKHGLYGTVIDVSLTDKKIVIKNDLGSPIEEKVDDLVNAYVKGNNSRTGTNGSGLGLAIVHNIIRLLKFKLHIEVVENQFVVDIKL